MKTAVLLLIFVARAITQILGPLSPGAIWYVDSINGSDSNNGTSQATAFKTIGKLVTQTLTAKQCVGFARGSVWREQLTVPVANACYGTYGAGSPPLFDCSDSISSGTWTKTGGFTNIYQVTVTADNVLGFLRIWENGINLPRVASQAILDSTPASIYVPADPLGNGTVSFTIYINPIGSTNPGSDGQLYEYNRRGYGVLSTLSGSVVSGIATRRNLANNGSFALGQFSFATDVIARDGHKHIAFLQGGSYWSGVSAIDSYYAGQGKIGIVLNDNNPGGLDATLYKCSYTESLETNGEGFFGHVNVGGMYGTVTLNQCSTSGQVFTAIGGYNALINIFTGGSYVGGIVLGAATSKLLSTSVTGTGGAGQVFIPFTANIEIGDTSITGSQTNGMVRIGSGATISPTVYIHGCTFSNSTAFDDDVYVNPGAIPTLIATGNIFLAPISINYIGGPGTGVVLSATYDNNTYHYPTAGSAWQNMNGISYNFNSGTNLTAWQTLGYDVHSVRVTP